MLGFYFLLEAFFLGLTAADPSVSFTSVTAPVPSVPLDSASAAHLRSIRSDFGTGGRGRGSILTWLSVPLSALPSSVLARQ